MVYHCQSFVSVDELKRAIVEAWQKLLQSFIDNGVGEWRRRLDCVVRATEWRTHLGWTSSKLITQIISLGPSLLGATTSAI